jgi:hypothetical protein
MRARFRKHLAGERRRACKDVRQTGEGTCGARENTRRSPKLAAWYKAEADKLEAQASDHEDLAAVYRSHPAVLGSKSSVPISGSAMHCSNLAGSLRAAAKEDRELAAEHELMAKGAEK